MSEFEVTFLFNEQWGTDNIKFWWDFSSADHDLMQCVVNLQNSLQSDFTCPQG